MVVEIFVREAIYKILTIYISWKSTRDVYVRRRFEKKQHVIVFEKSIIYKSLVSSRPLQTHAQSEIINHVNEPTIKSERETM